MGNDCQNGNGTDGAEQAEQAKIAAFRLAAIIEYSDDAIVSITVDGIVIGWNHGAERLYGYMAEEMIGQPIAVLFPPDHYQEYLRIMKEVKAGRAVPAFDTVRRRKDGTLINVSVGFTPIEARDGEVVGTSKHSHDITRIKKLEAQFIAAQKMEVVGHLAGGVAHDFNNILAVIMCYSDMTTSELDPKSPLQKYLEEIRHAARRAVGLTQQLLVFSSKQIVQPVVLNLNDTVMDMDKMLRRLIDENILMTIVPGKEIGRVKADSGYVGQVLMNLVVNARDAMPEGGKLTIATSAANLDKNYVDTHAGVIPGDYVMLSVTDSGTGMTDEVKKHLFEAFFTTKPKGKGTGLGLATCRTIMQQSGGHIGVESEIGKGTTFRAYFPRIEQPLDVTVVQTQSGPLPRGTETLLVVEDDPSVRHLARRVLEAQGYAVLLAANGQDALRVAHEHKGSPICLVVTDVIMPVMGGKAMAEWLKTSYPNLKILFTSGYTNDAIARDGVLEWYGLADEALEDALYDSQALRGFARIDLAADGVPDATTLLKFRRLLETNDLCKGLFTAINADLTARGLLLREGTLVDATLIAAPPSTKNKEKQRDPEMHQTRKGNQWYFGMKAHIGADRDSKLVHTLVVTAANVADITKTAELLHGQETQVHADAGYTGVEKRAEVAALERKIDWQIARKRGQIKKLAEGPEKETLQAVEKVKASVRAFVEHPFHIIKNIFRHRKVRYRGLAKNGHQLYTLFGLANVVIGARQTTA